MNMNTQEAADWIHVELLSGTRMSDIRKGTMKKWKLTTAEFKVALEQAKSDIKETQKESEDVSLGLQLERLYELLKFARESGNVKVELQINQEIDRILGLQQSNLNAKIDTDFTVSFGD